jgi:hypothetical protein
MGCGRMQVSVVVTERGAVYVNDSRITHRGTKWGLQNVLDTFECEREQVRDELLARGWAKHAENIDTPGYGVEV